MEEKLDKLELAKQVIRHILVKLADSAPDRQDQQYMHELADIADQLNSLQLIGTIALAAQTAVIAHQIPSPNPQVDYTAYLEDFIQLQAGWKLDQVRPEEWQEMPPGSGLKMAVARLLQ